MPVNFNLLRQTGPTSLAEGLAQGQEQQNALMQQQQQRQLNEVQLRNALRGEQEALAESEAAKGSTSLEDLARRQRQAGLGRQALATEAAAAKQRAERLTSAKTQLDLMKNAAGQILANPGAAVQILLRFGQMTGVDMSDDIAQIQQMDPDAIKKWAAGHALEADKLLPKFETRDLGGTVQRQGYSPITGEAIGAPTIYSKTLTPEGAKPTVTSRTRGDIAEIVLTNPLTGETTVSTGGTANIPLTQAQRLQDERERERIKIEGQRLGLEGRRVAVLEENLRRDADPAFQQRMANAKATGQAIAKGDVAAQQALPRVLSRAEEGLRLIDEMVGKQEVRDASGKVVQAATKPHPGFENAVGTTWLPGARFVPGTDASDFMSRFDQIKGASFLEAFETLKGGGAITEKEGAKGTDAINRMSIAQSEKEFIAAARDLQEVIRKGVMTAQRRVQMSSSPTSSSSGGQADPLGIR